MNDHKTSNTDRHQRFNMRTMVVCCMLLLITACTNSTSATNPATETAQSVQALGKTLHFTNPDHYCNLGDSTNEQMLHEQVSRALLPILLLHMAAPCTELNDFAAGNSDGVDHWLQIQLLEPNRHNVKREKYLADLTRQMPKLETEEMRQSLQDLVQQQISRADASIDLEMGAITFLGRDENAVYLSGSGELEANGTKHIIAALGAVTVINGMPIGIYVYDSTENPQSLQQQTSILDDFLHRILAANPN